MGLSTHVLDNVKGGPAVGMAVTLYRQQDGQLQRVKSVTLNRDGRTDEPLYSDGMLQVGVYRLVFEVARYFRDQGVALPQPPFLDEVGIDFGVADSQAHYHVPLLVTPWTYSTYRGS